MSQESTTSAAPQPICETIGPQLSAYVLGDYDPATRRLIEGHVRECRTCQRALAADTTIAALLPLSAPDAQPTPDLRDRVIEAVAAAAEGREQPGRTARRPGGLWSRSALVWRALGAALLVALLGWNVALQRDLSQLRATAQQQQALVALLQDPSVARRTLPTDGGSAPDARGALLVASDQQTAALTVEGMPALPPDRVYQLWLVDNGQRISGGTFTVDAAGRGALLIRPPQPLSSYDRAGITVEPRGGSPGPTSPRVIGGPLG
jgi:anti-sigma-K factor RskA